MKTQTSKTRIWFSSLLLLPIIATLFYSFAEREYIEKDISTTSEILEVESLGVFGEGATEAMMKEYNNWIIKFNTTHKIDLSKYKRIVAIYDIMSIEQRNSVEPYPVIPDFNLTTVKPKTPTKKQFEAWKNASEYAIWIDGKHIPNIELNNYNIDDIIYYTGSTVHKNARSKQFPQPNQYSLYTTQGFKNTYQESNIKKYKTLCDEYTLAIKNYLKGSQTDNSELRILKAQADKLYSSFTKTDLKKYDILPAPPVPAQKQQKPTQKQIAAYNTWAKNMNAKAVGERIVKLKDYKKYKWIYDAMSSKQRENAESFPQLPPPPPKPKNSKGGPNADYQITTYSSLSSDTIYARSINLKILDNNSYSIDGIKATKKTFVNVFNQLHQDITPRIRKKILNIHVSSSKDISNEEVWFIYNSLQDYGFYRIVTANQEINTAKGNTPFAIEKIKGESNTNDYQHYPIPPPIPENATPEERKKMQRAINEFEKKYKRKIYTVKTNETDELINFIADDQVYEPNKTQQQPTAKQIAAYNTWAKKINTELKKASKGKVSYPIVKQKEINAYKAIYNAMSQQQKKKAEPFPNFPPPPPPPPAPEAPKHKGVAEVLEIVEEQPYQDIVEESYNVPFVNEVVEIEEIVEDQEGKVTINGKDYFYKIKNGKTSYYDRFGNRVNISKLPPPPPHKTNGKGGPNTNDVEHYDYSNSETKELYLKKYKQYEALRHSKPHFISKSKKDKKTMSNLWVELRQMYFFSLSKKEKNNLKLPITPFAPYVKINKDGKSYYKVFSHLTPAEKKTMMISPKPSADMNNTLNLLNEDDPVVIPIGSYTLDKNSVKKENHKQSIILSVNQDGTYAISRDNTFKNFEILSLKDIEAMLSKLSKDQISNTFVFSQASDLKKFRSKPSNSPEYKDDLEITLIKEDIRFTITEVKGKFKELQSYQLALDNKTSENIKSNVLKLASLFKKYGITNLTI